MIRVTFDHNYIESLQDFYDRNECIREQQYLSRDKMLHLAAFCLSKIVNKIDESDDPRQTGSMTEAAIDAIRQLSVLCDTVELAGTEVTPSTIVKGQTNDERWSAARLYGSADASVEHTSSIQAAMIACAGLITKLGNRTVSYTLRLLAASVTKISAGARRFRKRWKAPRS